MHLHPYYSAGPWHGGPGATLGLLENGTVAGDSLSHWVSAPATPPRLRSPHSGKAAESPRSDPGIGSGPVGCRLLTLATMPASCMKSRLSRVVFLAIECVLRRAKRSRSVRCSALLYLVAASSGDTEGGRKKNPEIRRRQFRPAGSGSEQHRGLELTSHDQQDKHNPHERRAARGKVL